MNHSFTHTICLIYWDKWKHISSTISKHIICILGNIFSTGGPMNKLKLYTSIRINYSYGTLKIAYFWVYFELFSYFLQIPALNSQKSTKYYSYYSYRIILIHRSPCTSTGPCTAVGKNINRTFCKSSNETTDTSV